jgi:hypothetical protein
LGALVVTTDVDRAVERLAELRARLRAGVPGTYEGIGDEEYHGDPVEAGSLSSTEVRKLIDTPRRFYAYKFGGARPQTAAQLRGIAAHARVLGSGPRIVVLGEDEGSDALTDAKGKPTTSRNARSVQEWCEEQEALGRLVLTPTERDTIEGMATALREHPDAGALFDPARGGIPEVTCLAEHEETGVVLRMKTDWLPALDLTASRLRLADYKTSRRASLDAIRRHVEEYGYFVQGAHYLLILSLLGIGTDPLTDRFCLVVQETEPPYIVTVAAIDRPAIRDGLDAVRWACRRYVACLESGEWPDYTSHLPHLPEIGRPKWASSPWKE